MSSAVGITSVVDGVKPTASLASKPAVASTMSLSRRIPELDGYRGMAVALGLFFHYIRFPLVARPPKLLGYLYTTTPLSWSGMEIFFLLSGFLICGILMDARNSPNYFSTYYIRRFCRILPIYFVYVGVIGLAYLVVYRPVGERLNWMFAGHLPWYAYLSFGQNWWMATRNSFGPPVFSITWSLAVEEQFYLLLPLVIRFVRRSALPYVFIAGIAAAPLVRLFIVSRFPGHLVATFVLLPCRMDSLFLGALCAYGVRQPAIWSWLIAHRTTLKGVLLALVIGMPPLNNAGIPYTLLWLAVGIGWMSIFYATTLLLVLTNSNSRISRVMRWPAFTNFGVIAYSMYLFHLGIYCFCMWFLMGHGWRLETWQDFGVTVLSAAITITICNLSWRFFEKPIVRWSHRWQY